jgi:lipoate---protein ligase
MTSPIRLIDTGSQPARRNIAITAALADLHCAGEIGDTFRFHVYPRSVLIGHHQDIRDAADVDFCAASGIEIARRVTGGGSVYMAPGILAWDLVVDRKRFAASLSATMELICNGLAAGLSTLGVPARFRPENAIEIEGRKIAGCSGVFSGSTFLAQGTLLLDFDADEMTKALHLPKPVIEGVSSVAAFLGNAPEMNEIKARLVEGLAQHMDCRFAPAALSDAEQRHAARLYDTELGRDDFVFGDARETPSQARAAAEAVSP